MVSLRGATSHGGMFGGGLSMVGTIVLTIHSTYIK